MKTENRIIIPDTPGFNTGLLELKIAEVLTDFFGAKVLTVHRTETLKPNLPHDSVWSIAKAITVPDPLNRYPSPIPTRFQASELTPKEGRPPFGFGKMSDYAPPPSHFSTGVNSQGFTISLQPPPQSFQDSSYRKMSHDEINAVVEYVGDAITPNSNDRWVTEEFIGDLYEDLDNLVYLTETAKTNLLLADMFSDNFPVCGYAVLLNKKYEVVRIFVGDPSEVTSTSTVVVDMGRYNELADYICFVTYIRSKRYFSIYAF
jgi:hypothetical protein